MVRLFLDCPLAAGQSALLTQDQAHYLTGVMRLAAGAEVLVFNGRDGEWRARLEGRRREAKAVPVAQVRVQGAPPDVWLLFAPVKKARTDFIVEKAVEMGAARLVPVQTAFTNAERIRQDRLQAHAREAAEQCGATWVPEVAEMVALDRLLAGWPGGRRLFFCDEGAGLERAVGEDGPAAILVGPEGGFSVGERQRLLACPQVTQFGLGPRILRADTAAVAAMALWQVRHGDWR